MSPWLWIGLAVAAVVVWALVLVYSNRRGIWPSSHGPAAGGN